MTIKDKIEYIWLYSRYYAEMIFTAQRLYSNEEGYAATVILLNATELIFKSIRENFSQNFNQDIAALTNAGLLEEDEKDFFENKQFGLREIRNIMTHREAYQYCFESSTGEVLPFVEADTWMTIYSYCSPKIIDILYNVLVKSRGRETKIL